MEALSHLLIKAREGDFISSFKVGGRDRESVEVAYLLYADNAIIFYEASQEYLVF